MADDARGVEGDSTAAFRGEARSPEGVSPALTGGAGGAGGLAGVAATAPGEGPAEEKSSLARQALPWLIAGGALVWVFSRVPFAEALGAMRNADIAAFASAIMVAAVYWFLVESRAWSYLFTRFNTPVSWQEARALRGVAYLLTPINWNAGTALVIHRLSRDKAVPYQEGIGSFMLFSAADLFVFGALVAGSGASVAIGVGMIVVQGVVLSLATADRPDWGWLRKLRGSNFFLAYRAATMGDVMVLCAFRTVYFAGFVLLFWLGTRAFDVIVPLVQAAQTMPLILASSTVTPAGLGAQQAAILELYQPFGDEASLLAFGLAFPLGLMFARLGIGLVYLPQLLAQRRSDAGG